ncbi:MAG: flagellar M-ring protein FliF [Myxococcales bacterium]|nr:flagellar M-ring protein FliF [Myxococcales bacterium]
MSESNLPSSASANGKQSGPRGSDEEPLLPVAVREALDKARSIWRRLPISLRVFIFAAIGTSLAIGSYFALAPLMREQAVLFANIEGEDAGAIVAKLKAQQIPYELSADGTTIRVPKDLVHELRLTLAAEGLPRGGNVGFESFENLRLGATEFEQQVTYRRAMEGELARTIGTIRSVQSTRVHLVLPKPSVFAQKSEPASASVVLKLKGASLERSEVMSIVHLVAAAVPDLDPARVSIVTTDGTMLHRPRTSAGAGGVDDDDEGSHKELDQIAQARQLETVLEQRARSMLERVIGNGHVDVSVSADVDVARIETTADTYNHGKSSLRSEQEQIERAGAGTGTGADTLAGVPGAEANLPQGADTVDEAPAVGDAGASVKRQHTRNFEIDRVQERRTRVAQSVKRLTVAVLVDGVAKDGVAVARPAEELEKLGELVRSAIGFSEERGDVVTVESVPFFTEVVPPEEDLSPIPAPIREKYGKYFPLARPVGFGILGLIGLFIAAGWIRRMRNWMDASFKLELASKEHTAKLALEAAKRAEALGSATDGEVKQIHYRTEALRRATEDPATAALVLRQWLGEAAPVLSAADQKAQTAKKAA